MSRPLITREWRVAVPDVVHTVEFALFHSRAQLGQRLSVVAFHLHEVISRKDRQVSRDDGFAEECIRRHALLYLESVDDNPETELLRRIRWPGRLLLQTKVTWLQPQREVGRRLMLSATEKSGDVELESLSSGGASGADAIDERLGDSVDVAIRSRSKKRDGGASEVEITWRQSSWKRVARGRVVGKSRFAE